MYLKKYKSNKRENLTQHLGDEILFPQAVVMYQKNPREQTPPLDCTTGYCCWLAAIQAL